ncbi:ATP-binding SpoIIE family protein phosphatase [Amycolatopsis granulosa]|uniref:ATP-binding SpoIIE family protein phosphatase n=1 Tax=Amycolatopsis granulosa TaxID=185684 RepID=UPI0014235265|nr:SpoIIE family protein phosphatase [Amycolatopsis granulosa]NIH85135.1 anti-sigma regulatory factor (Ser/Thr protein kinase)/putative methionine-R-sulfoxide reductase with GAF domain [Amycolatopsis granulosa]
MSTSASTRLQAEQKLQRIGLVSDSALAHLAAEDLLTELLDRVRQVLHTDTAAVLLLEPGGRELLAVAARGIETEVAQGVRVPVGKGFAGQVVARREPVQLQRVDSTTVVNRLLWEKGIQTLLGVPLLVGGEPLGVLHVGTLSKREFTPEDVELLQLAADRIALAAHAQRSQAERAAAAELQRSLLPSKLPVVPGLELAARYVPGDQGAIAGDWYDVFLLPNNWLGVVIGDVVGHGLPAAIVMGRMRSALRAFALEGGDPAEVLVNLDRKMQHFEPGMMATVLYAVVEPNFERLHVSSAGHLVPVQGRVGEPARLLDVAVDPPIGALRDVRRRVSVVDIPPGSVVCFYTDGLVERRGVPLDEGLDRLCAAVRPVPVTDVCADVMGAMIGEDNPDDDVALLAVRRQDGSEVGPLDLAVPAVPESLKEVRSAMRRWLNLVGASPDATSDLLVAVGEATSNAVEHAYGPAGGVVRVQLDRHGSDVIARVCDEGRWRPPRGENRGRGTLLMHRCGDEVRIDHRPQGTEVMIRRTIVDGQAQ